MMFLIHAALALGLMSLTVGAALYIWALRNTGTGSCLGRVVGFVVMIVSTLSLVCCFYLGVKIWKEIYYMSVAQVNSPQNANTANTLKEHHKTRSQH